MRNKTVSVGKDVRVSLLMGKGDEWLGIGDVRVGGVPLRCARWPMVVRLDTPDGYVYSRFFLEKVRARRDGSAQVRLRAVGFPWSRTEYLDEYMQAMVNVAIPHEAVNDSLTLNLSPAKLALGGREWTGLSWSFEFSSRKRRIHRVLVHGTWELGGSIVGNTVLNQGQCNMPVYRGAKGTLFTTTCLKTLDRYGSPQGVSYQLAHRAGLLQGFDFQHGKRGAMLHYWPKFDAISSIVESPKGSTLLHVVDEYRFSLTGRVTTTPQHVLFTPGKVAEHEARDLWWEAYQHVYGGIRRSYGIRETPVRPEAGLCSYGTTPHEGRLRVCIMGEEVDSTETLDLVAEKVLPRLAEQGIRRFFPIPSHESDVTELGLKRKLDSGIHGDYICASVCASHRFFPSEFWGGIKGWRHMAEAGRRLGIEIGCWFAPHFSPRAKIFKEHRDWLTVGPDTHAWGGGYGFLITTADWNTGIYDWVLSDFRRWQEEGGLDYIFIDSWANMGLLEHNFAQRMRNNFKPLARLLGDIQKLGVKSYTFEGISALGPSRIGMADLRGDLLEATQGIAGQNDFGWWVDNPDMAFGICMGAGTRKRSEEEVKGLQFRFMANRACLMAETRISSDYTLPDWEVRLNRIYERVLPHMKTRRMLEMGGGVLWHGDGVNVLWAYRDQVWLVRRGASVSLVEADGLRPVTHEGRVTARAGCVYLLR